MKFLITFLASTFCCVILAVAIKVDAQLEGPYSNTARSELPFNLQPSIVPVQTTIILSEGTTVTNTVLDQILTQETSAVYGTAYSLNVQLGPRGGTLADWYAAPRNTNVATNSNAYNVYWRSNGVTTLDVTVWNTEGVTNVYTVPNLSFVATTNTVSIRAQGAAPGSARAFFTSGVDGRLAMASNSMATNGLVYTTQSHAATNYVRNTNGWWTRGTNANITAVSPWNSTDGAKRAGTLITPQHVLAAAHYPINVGASIRFVDQTNGVVSRTVTHAQVYPGYVPYYPDFQVLLLDSAVPTNRITPAKVLPANWRTYLPTDILDIPTAGLDQEEKMTVQNGQRVSFSTGNKVTSFNTPGTNTPARVLYFENKIGGDSGNPALLIPPDGSAPVLLTVWTFGGAGGGTSVTDFVSGLNSAIHNIDSTAGTNTGFQLQTYDLSTFNAY